MTERRWSALDPGRLIPSDVTDAVDALSDQVVTPMSDMLSALIEVIGLAKYALLLETDPILIALDAALATVQALIDGLDSQVGLHGLFVPVIYPRVAPPTDEYEFYSLHETLPSAAKDLNNPDLTLANESPSLEGGGGNWGFYTTFANSLADDKDLHRPEYPSTFAVMSLTFLLGAKDLGTLLLQLNTLSRLLGKLVHVPLDNNVLPVPQNLRVVAVGPLTNIIPQNESYEAGDDTDSLETVLVRWDTPDLFTSELFHQDLQIDLMSTTLYVKRNEPFTQYDLGDTLASYGVLETTNPHLYTTASLAELDEDVDYYVAAGYGCQMTVQLDFADGEPEEVVTDFKHYDLGNQVRVNLAERRGPLKNLGGGTPPDWVSVGQPLDIVPGVSETLAAMKSFVQSLRDQIASPLDELEEFLEDAEAYLAHLVSQIQRIASVLRQISDTLRALRTGIHMYGMYADEGGSDLLVAEMNQALFNPQTIDPPPFNSGTDLVAGVVLVAGCPSPNILSPAMDVLRLLFGDIFRKVGPNEVLESPEPPETGIQGDLGASLDEAVKSLHKITEDVELQTGAILAATGLIGHTEEVTDVVVDPVEVEVSAGCAE